MPEPPISFARGAPAPELIPADELADCAHEVAKRDGAKVFAYGPGGGYAPLREWIAERHGVAAGRVVVTVGGLQGFVFYAAEQLARRPGRVLVEAPSYDRPLKVLARDGAEIVALPMDDEGLDPDALAAELDSRPDAPSFLYTIPTFQNPSGRTLSAARRTRLVEIAREHSARGAGGRPVRARALRRDGAAEPARARGRHAGHVHVVVLEDGRARRSHRLLRPPGLRRRRVRGARRVDVHLAAVPPRGDRLGVHPARSVRAEPRAGARGAARAPRRDARRARSSTSEDRAGAPPRAGTSSGSTSTESTRRLSPRAGRTRAWRSSRDRGSSRAARGWGRASARLAFSYETPARIARGNRAARVSYADRRRARIWLNR